MTGVLISRCICQNLAFSQLRVLAETNRWQLSDLIENTGCGAQCGLCRPYLRAMIETGQTEFRELLPQDPIPTDVAES